MAMNREDLVMFCCSDIAGQVRGKGFPARDMVERMVKGVGWTPTNLMITAFGPIADSPWGALDDLLLMPDGQTETRSDFGDERPEEHFVLCDIVEMDGSPWDCCTRGFLKAGLTGLEQRGLRLLVAFEHELHYEGALERRGWSYSLDAMRRQDGFAESFVHALDHAGVEPEAFRPDYGPRQYAVTCGPTLGLEAADRAVILRELAHATARRLGHGVSFSPLVGPDGGVGNGLNIHMSLQDLNGLPVTYDPGTATGLSEVAGRFVAGILKHLPALCALTAPGVVSYKRLVPRKRSAAYNNLGTRDREAAVRLCPISEQALSRPEDQFNFEFRAADCAASPYMVLGALVRAGLAGLDAKLPEPRDNRGDHDEAELARRGVVRLPTSLGAALEALAADPIASGWLSDRFLQAYLSHKRTEIEIMKDLTLEERCARYAEVY